MSGRRMRKLEGSDIFRQTTHADTAHVEEKDLGLSGRRHDLLY